MCVYECGGRSCRWRKVKGGSEGKEERRKEGGRNGGVRRAQGQRSAAPIVGRSGLPHERAWPGLAGALLLLQVRVADDGGIETTGRVEYKSARAEISSSGKSATLSLPNLVSPPKTNPVNGER